MSGFSSLLSAAKVQQANAVLLSNFKSYKTKEAYNRAAQYVVVLAGGQVKEGSLLG